VTSGKVRYIGLSDLPAWKVSEAQTIAHLRGWSPVVALQLEYSLMERTVEGELIPMAQSMGIGAMPWSPLKNGFLSGKYSRDNAGSVGSPRSGWVGQRSEADYVVIDALQAVSAEVGASPAAIALAWVRSRPGVASTLIGARRMDQLTNNLAALEVTLTAEQIATLDAVSKPVLSFPAGYAQITQMSGFPGTMIDGVQTPPSPMLSASTVRY
jgi:aryl-alcohol dehydrogenase-like predicted oxidoreductase